MNNKKGGFLAKLLIILFLMLASAVAGAYAYRVIDGKLAVKDATREINAVDVNEYDTEEAQTIDDYVEEFLLKIDDATTRRDVYDLLVTFKQKVDKIPTKEEKEAETKAKEDAASNNSSDATESEDESDHTGLFNFGKLN